MSRIARFHQSRRFVTTGLVLIGLAASAAMSQARSQTPEAALLNRVPVAASSVVASAKKSPAIIDGDRTKGVYFAQFTGVGAGGRDMVWRGAVSGAAVGELTVHLAHVGRDTGTAKSTWPVEGIIFVSGNDPRRAFAAEVHGTIDWRTERAKLEGDVSLGYMRGRHLELIADLIDCDLSGELRLAPTPVPAPLADR